MRIFVALDMDDAIRSRIQRFMEGVQEFAPDVRWVRPESLHVTLKFIGEQPEESVEQVKRALSQVASKTFYISFRGFGFFPLQNLHECSGSESKRIPSFKGLLPASTPPRHL